MAPYSVGIAVAALVTGVTASTAWAVHLVRARRAGDTGDLAAKLAVPFPRRAADWPELRLDAVVLDPGSAERVLVVARWPAHPELRAVLVLDVDDPTARAHHLLMLWRDVDASLSQRSFAADHLVLRRRRSQDAVTARILGETVCSSETRP